MNRLEHFVARRDRRSAARRRGGARFTGPEIKITSCPLRERRLGDRVAHFPGGAIAQCNAPDRSARASVRP